MKVTSFRDVETYIYSSLISRLKGLNIPEINFPSPIRGESGQTWELGIQSEPLQREFRRNYQRTQAQRKANTLIVLYAEGKEYIVGCYYPRQKWVKLYKKPFKQLNATPLMGRLFEAFYTETPFGKVIMADSHPRPRPFRHRRNRGHDYGEEAYDSDDGYDEEMPF